MATIAITGVASGIGAELAKILKSRGDRVIGFDISPTADNTDHLIRLDLNDAASIEAATADFNEPLDGLCNIAGIPPRPGLEAAILQVNFLGQRTFTRAMLPHLQSGASIVNMASKAGYGWRDSIDQVKRLSALGSSTDIPAFLQAEGIEATRAYNLSKEAMILWTMSEAEPLIARGIRINSLSPAAVATGILDDFARAFGDMMAKNVARAGRPGTPQEIAQITAFLLSPDSHWIKGTDIAIDGGMGAFATTGAFGLESLRVL